MYTSGRELIYRAIHQLEAIRDRFAEGSINRIEADTALVNLYHGQYLNEEQLKAMRRLGYQDGDTTGWLDDDFD